MFRVRALVASCLVAISVVQTAAQDTAARPAETAPAAHPSGTASELERIRRGLARPPTPLAEHVGQPDSNATFHVSVTEKPFDLGAFWGEPGTAVAAYVRPPGGTWHHEFKQMVTPDLFKGYANLSNAEGLQLMASSVAFAAAMALLQTGVRVMRDAAYEREKARAREQVQRELAEFLKLYGIRPPN